MTPVNSTRGSNNLPYDIVTSGDPMGAADPYAAAYEQALVGDVDYASNVDVDYASNVDVDTGYDATGGYGTESDPYAGYASAASPVAGTQPATTPTVPVATLEDFVDLGVFNAEELAQIAEAYTTPEQLGALYVATIEYLSSEGLAQRETQPQTAQQDGPVIGINGNPDLATDVAATADPAVDEANAEPGWTDAWTRKFQDGMRALGLDSQTRLLLVSMLRDSGATEQELQQAYDFYINSDEGRAQLEQANRDVLAGKPDNAKQLLMVGTLSLFGVGGMVALAKNPANLTKALEHVVSAAGKRSEQGALAAKALERLKAGEKLVAGSDVANDALRALRGQSAVTGRLGNPIAKVRLNAAARGLTPAAKLPLREAVQYGLGMKIGDNAGSVAKAVTSGAKAVGGGEAAAIGSTARTVGTVSKAMRWFGPVALVASTAVGAWAVSETVKAEGGFGEESAKLTGNLGGGLAGAVAGAAAGAAIGSVVPVIGTGIGALVGGLIGGFGGGAIGEAIGGALHNAFSSKPEPEPATR